MKKRLLNLVKEYKSKGIKNLYYVKHSNPEYTWYCGYVTVGKDHPLYDSYDVDNEWSSAYDELNVHGGITFVVRNKPNEELTIGFDQNHSGDMSSNINDDDRFVASETHSLARQLCKMYDNMNNVIDADKSLREYKKKVTDWYIDDFLGLKDDVTGLSDHFENLVKGVSDEYFSENIEPLYVEEHEVTTEKVLDWYFSGSDQEQESTLIDLGRRVKDSLFESGEFYISADQIADECAEVYNDENKNK
jgi:hypothetical protein